MSQAFYDAVQTALETYACELGAEPWFYAAAGFAAAGQGVGALAATIGGVATATACNRPPGPPGPGEDPLITFDSGPGDGQLYNWQIVTEGSYKTYDQQQGGPDDSFCNYPQVISLNNDSWRPTVSARRIKLRVRNWLPGNGFCGTDTYRVEQQLDDSTTWTGTAAVATWTCWESGVTAWAYKLTAPKPPRPPLPAPPDRKITLNWTENNLNINNDIKIKAPDFIFAPSGDFILSFPIDVQVGPKFAVPFSFNFDLNYSTGGQGEPDGYGNQPKGSGPKLPPAERPTECPEIPEDPQISGSWSKADCINGEPLFTPVNWSGKGFAGVADALNKLNNVIGPWQENSYDCDEDLPMEPIFAVPISQYTGQVNFEPSVTLHFYEPNQLAIEAGRTNRVRRSISIPVATPPSDPQSFLDTECRHWADFEWRCGTVVCRARLQSGKSVLTVNAESDTEGQRVLDAVMSRYGQAFDPIGGLRFSTGSVPTDSQGRGGLRITTTVKFHSIGYSTMGENYGPKYPDSVMARGASQRP